MNDFPKTPNGRLFHPITPNIRSEKPKLFSEPMLRKTPDAD